MFDTKTMTVTVGGVELTFKTGELARQADGAVTITAGETMVFSSACATKNVPEHTDFFPLRVDYQEYLSSTGRTLGGFIKRQGKLSQRDVLVSRLIDRPLRPMFEEGYYNEVQVLAYVWSYDGVHSPEPLAICAASAALAISDIPLIKPIAAVRVGRVNGKFVVNPTTIQQEESTLDLMIAGTVDAVLMIEGYCDFLTEEEVIEAIELGHKETATICHAITKWAKEIGKPKFRDTIKDISPATMNAVKELAVPKLIPALRISNKQQREVAVKEVHDAVAAALCPADQAAPEHTLSDFKKAFKKVQAKLMREMIVSENIRSDGRKSTDIRPIDIKMAYLPRAHGSSVFTRGETQALAVCTLGGEHMAQRYEDLEGEDIDRFYLQYFFPPFSVGEVGRMGAPGRREVGHGKLAERALRAALPSREDFPYVIRLESNITESNGSSSMASVCGGCLCMMNAGVPIKRPVSGIAMGLILEENGYTILSDILGIEDALGDMDFKITGDHEGITAFQMDIKVEGITVEIMKKALHQAKDGRIHILDKMLEVCPEPGEMSKHAPRIEIVRIPINKIALLIGPGGKNIRRLIEDWGVEIDINDDGLVSISSTSASGIEGVKSEIEALVAEVEVLRVYNGRIVSLVPFGAFVEVIPGKEGLCHISEFSNERIEKMEDVAKVGDIISVKVMEINDRGQIKLSRKATLKA